MSAMNRSTSSTDRPSGSGKETTLLATPKVKGGLGGGDRALPAKRRRPETGAIRHAAKPERDGKGGRTLLPEGLGPPVEEETPRKSSTI